MSAVSVTGPGDATVDPNNENISTAARRLAQEVRQATSSFKARGVRDVTSDFVKLSGNLGHGELVKDEHFTLFEAVGALEIMDVKMDSGYVPPGDSFMSDFDICAGRKASEIIWVMDQLLILEITWHEGYPLSQTIFSSLYIDRLLSPDNKFPYNLDFDDEARSGAVSNETHLVHKVLRAYCVGLIKCCQLVLFIIQSQNFYEEEDFVTHLFGRDLLPAIGTEEARIILDEAVLWLEEADIPAQLREALLSRLNFRLFLLRSAGNNESHWDDLVSNFPDLQHSHALASSLPESFSDKVQRQLATSTPPRPMLELDWDEACKMWLRMFGDIIEVEGLTLPHISQSPSGLQRTAWAFTYREPQPNTYARSIFQDILFRSDRVADEMTHFDLLLKDIRDLVLAGDCLADPQSFQVELTSDPRHICSRHVETFMDRVFDEYLNLYRMVCQNRCRIRRTFTQAIAIFDALETEAKRWDGQIHTVTASSNSLGGKTAPAQYFPLASWTKFHKLQIMIRTIQLGFETDIFLPHEMCEMYYLMTRYNESLLELLEHIDHYLRKRIEKLIKTRHTAYVAEAIASQDFLQSLRLRATHTYLMSRALGSLYNICHNARLIRPPKCDYAQAQLLYEARMKPYLSVKNDDLPTLSDFEDARQPHPSFQVATQAIESDIRDAKVLGAQLKKTTPAQGNYVGTEEQWKREIKQCETTCVALVVQTAQLTRICEKAGREDFPPGEDLSDLVEIVVPPPGKRYHDWWVVPQLKAKTAK